MDLLVLKTNGLIGLKNKWTRDQKGTGKNIGTSPTGNRSWKMTIMPSIQN